MDEQEKQGTTGVGRPLDLLVDEHEEEVSENGRTVRRRGVYLLPNLFTTGALFAGFLAIAQPFDEQGASVPGAATGGLGAFAPAGTLAEGCFHHTATLLPDGRVIVIGGREGEAEGHAFGGGQAGSVHVDVVEQPEILPIETDFWRFYRLV